jgi:hypothetical protein
MVIIHGAEDHVNERGRRKMYKGCIIKESIGDELIFDLVEIERSELWRTNEKPKYWTAVFFTSKDEGFPEKLSRALTGNWYVDMKQGDTKIIVFSGKVLRYTMGDAEAKEEVMDYCRSRGIPERQLDWPE